MSFYSLALPTHMPGKTAQKRWGEGPLPKGAAVYRLEAERAGKLGPAARSQGGLGCSTQRQQRRRHRQEEAACSLGGILVSLPAGATSPSLSPKCNLAKVILLYEEGVLPSA